MTSNQIMARNKLFATLYRLKLCRPMWMWDPDVNDGQGEEVMVVMDYWESYE